MTATPTTPLIISITARRAGNFTSAFQTISKMEMHFASPGMAVAMTHFARVQFREAARQHGVARDARMSSSGLHELRIPCSLLSDYLCRCRDLRLISLSSRLTRQ